LCLDRFSSLRRVPGFLISDNGTNFVFVQPLVGTRVKLTDAKVHYFSTNKIEWHFIPAFSPWYGGVYERMVGLFKLSVHKTLTAYGSNLVDYVTLHTVLYRAANIVNNRPLTFVPSDELYKPLTPNHFLKLGESNVDTSIELDLARLPSTTLNLIQGYQTVLGLVRTFQDIFHSQYFTYLKDRMARYHRHPWGSLPRQPAIGDVVLIADRAVPRATWPIGLVTSVDHRGGKAKVRSQETISTLNLPGGRHTQIVNKEYTCNRLFPLELAQDQLF